MIYTYRRLVSIILINSIFYCSGDGLGRNQVSEHQDNTAVSRPAYKTRASQIIAIQDQALSTNDNNKYILKNTNSTSDNCRREGSRKPLNIQPVHVVY